MKTLIGIRWLLVAGLVGLMIAGCAEGGGGDESSAPPPQAEDNTGFQFTMSAYDPAETGQAGGIDAMTETVDGVLVAVNGDGDVFYWEFSVVVDGSDFEIESELAVPLPEGAYDFYFILESPSGRQYAGIAPSRYIFENDNLVRFHLYPIIGGEIPYAALHPAEEGSFDLEVLSDLGALQFQFDYDALTTFGDPNIGIKVDDGTQRLFSVNKLTGLSEAFLFLPEGTYTIEVRFYDGGTLMNVPIVFEVTVSGDGELQVVELDIVVNHTPEPDSGTGVFTVVVPAIVMDEADGVENVATVFTLHRNDEQLFEATVSLLSAGDTYEGTVLVPEFETGDITWSVQFVDTNTQELPVFAYCAQEVLLATGSQTLICNLHLADRDAPLETLPGSVSVSTKASGVPIAGSVIQANGQPVGITGSGALIGDRGTLNVFLAAGDYTITAISPDGEEVLQTLVKVAADGVHTINFNFRHADVTPPEVTITSPQPGITNDYAPTLAFESNEQGTVRVWLNGSLVEVANGEQLGTLDDGPYTVEVSVTDAAGNSGSDAVDFEVDALAPQVSIQYPVNGTYVNSNEPVVIFTSGESGTAEIVIDGGAPIYEEGIVLDEPVELDVGGVIGGPYSEGDHTILVTIVDAAGNNSNVASAFFTVDTVEPLVEITAPAEEIAEREPILNYRTDDPDGRVSVYLDRMEGQEYGQRIATRNGEPLPRLDDGEHNVQVDVEDVAGNVGSDILYFLVQGRPTFQTIELEPSLTRRPTERTTDGVWFDDPAVLRIPTHDDIEMLVGNPQRYLLFLRLGSVSCVYLGGTYSSHVGGEEVAELEWFREFRSPVCGFGRYHAGDEIEVEGPVSARILTADQNELDTTLRITIEIIESQGEPRHYSLTNIWKRWHFHHGRHHHHHWKHHPRWRWDNHHHDDDDDDGNNGHGNDGDRNDGSNPGQGNGNGRDDDRDDDRGRGNNRDDDR